MSVCFQCVSKQPPGQGGRSGEVQHEAHRGGESSRCVPLCLLPSGTLSVYRAALFTCVFTACRRKKQDHHSTRRRGESKRGELVSAGVQKGEDNILTHYLSWDKTWNKDPVSSLTTLNMSLLSSGSKKRLGSRWTSARWNTQAAQRGNCAPIGASTGACVASCNRPLYWSVALKSQFICTCKVLKQVSVVHADSGFPHVSRCIIHFLSLENTKCSQMYVV